MKFEAASASGVSDEATSASVPTVTSCTDRKNAQTTAIVVSNANGTSRLGVRASPAGNVDTSKPPKANISSKTASPVPGVIEVEKPANRLGSTKNTPASTKPPSGTSLLTVKKFTVQEP